MVCIDFRLKQEIMGLYYRLQITFEHPTILVWEQM